MRDKGMTQFTLIEKEFPLEANTQQELLAEATKRFDYESLLADQKKLVGERLDLVRRYIDSPGRRYRMYHGAIREGLNFKPVGPVYHVPESLEKELADKRKEQAGSAVNAAGVLIQKSQFRRHGLGGRNPPFREGKLGLRIPRHARDVWAGVPRMDRSGSRPGQQRYEDRVGERTGRRVRRREDQHGRLPPRGQEGSRGVVEGRGANLPHPGMIAAGRARLADRQAFTRTLHPFPCRTDWQPVRSRTRPALRRPTQTSRIVSSRRLELSCDLHA